MSTEWFTALALPASVADDAPLHVRVFVAPALTPTSPDAVLAEFDLFRRWGEVVAGGSRVTLVDQVGEFDAELVLDGLDPALWPRAFGEDTPVRGNRVPEWQDRDWRTFAAKDCADIAKAVHIATVAADPLAPIAPLEHPLTEALVDIARQAEAFRIVRGGAGTATHDRIGPRRYVYDESFLTAWLDDRIPRGREGAWTTPEAGRVPPAGPLSGSVAGALQQLHLARRFYERPESQVADQVLKSPPDRVEPLPRHGPEFHERVAAAGDHPLFLERLGLVLPVRSDPARLRRSEWLAAVVRLDGFDDVCRSPRLAVRALPRDEFVSRTNPDDPPIWADGALTLGDTDRFDVVDLDPDGSAIKAERFLTTIPRLALAQAEKTPADAASPALRASGLTVTRRQQAGRALNQLDRQQGYQAAIDGGAPPQDQPLLHTQDVTRGMRVEVWDSVSRVWHSLHSRLSSLLVDGAAVYTDEPSEGFIQGTSATETRTVPNSPIHVHEAMFGWEGWSLSVPRPGKRVRSELSDAPGGGTRISEVAEPTPTDLTGEETHPFAFTHRLATGTLPRLRYGRDYAFRAWAVDLAGGVRPHHVGPRPPAHTGALTEAANASPLSERALLRRVTASLAHDAPGLASTFAAALVRADSAEPAPSADSVLGSLADPAEADTIAAQPKSAGRGPRAKASARAAERAVEIVTERAGDRILDALTPADLRNVVIGVGLGRPAVEALEAVEGTAGAGAAGAGPAAAFSLRDVGLRGAEALEALAAPPAAPPGLQSRTAAVGAAFRAAAVSGKVARSTVTTDLESVRDLLAGHLVDVIGPGGRITPPVARAVASTVTPLRPFLRWDPVPPPVVVPLAAFTEGESLRVVVVRSGVTQDPDTLEVSLQDPADYAASVAGVAPLYARAARRHLAPPKTSQVQAELHGMFDDGIDVGTVAARKKMLAWALRESGTFYDRSIPHASNPTGAARTQPGVRLLPEPQGGDHFNPHDPKRPLKVLPPGDAGTPAELVLQPGDAPSPGQYVVHDTTALTLPYLPDPLAAGVSLAFTQAGGGRHVAFPWGAEQVTAPYGGTWPDAEPFLLTLAGGEQLGATISGRAIEVALPAGDVQAFRLASTVPEERLPWFGVWRSLDEALTSNEDVREAAADGLLWSLTPGEEVRLVHAVPRPVLAPRPTTVVAHRAAGSVLASLLGGVEVHGPSTERLTTSLTWTDLVDDVNLDGPVSRTSQAAGFDIAVRPDDRIVPLWVVDQTFPWPGWEGVILRSTVHPMPDTRHHRVKYRFRASTRFREYFAPSLLAGDPANPVDDGRSTVSEELEISLPSTVRPDPPKVHSVLPLFRWEESEEPEQPFGRRRTRRSGVRIYLHRPWNSSGDGELLAVLLAAGGDDTTGYPKPKDPAAKNEGFAFVSQWGSDPLWNAPGVATRPVSLAELDDALSLTGTDDRVEPGRPVAPVVTLPLPISGEGFENAPATVPVMVAGYRPQYSPSRRLWYVDVAFDARATFWPFVRLAVARYQPESVVGTHLSMPVRLDQVQLTPARTLSVSRTDDRHARVVVSGLAGHRESASRQYAVSVGRNRRVVARLQRYDPAVGGDLAWTSVDTIELVPRGYATRPEDLVWVGELKADDVVDVRTPVGGAPESLDASSWRVRVEEWERFPGDPPPRSELRQHGEAPIWEQRLVYADDVYL